MYPHLGIGKVPKDRERVVPHRFFEIRLMRSQRQIENLAERSESLLTLELSSISALIAPKEQSRKGASNGARLGR
jgi:hypothetical protein